MRNFFLAIALLAVVGGCGVIPTAATPNEPWPVYDIPAAPKVVVPETVKPGQSRELDIMIENLYLTTSYVEALRTMLEMHNEKAKLRNQRVETAVGR